MLKNSSCIFVFFLLITFSSLYNVQAAAEESSKIILKDEKDTESVLSMVNLYYEQIIKGSLKEAYQLRSSRVKNMLKYKDFESSYKSLLKNAPKNSIAVEKAKLLFISDNALATGNNLIFYFPVNKKDHLGEVNLKLVTFVVKEKGLWRIDDTGIDMVAANLDLVAKMNESNIEKGMANSPLAACSSNLKSMATALELWAIDNSGLYPDSLDKLSPIYFRAIPFCPTTGAKYSYSVNKHPSAYEIICKGDHTAAGSPPDYPRYSSSQGLLTNPVSTNPGLKF